MLKKLSLLVAAFALGTLVSLSIQACADDIDDNAEVEINENNGGDDNVDASSLCNCSWDSLRMAYREGYDETGEMSYKCEFKYDSQKRVTSMAYIIYAKDSSGKRYISSRQDTSYTYSSSGDTRYASTTMTFYHEDGTVSGTSKLSEKIVLYTD